MKRFILSLSVLTALFAGNVYAQEESCQTENKQWVFNCTEGNAYMKQFLTNGWNTYLLEGKNNCVIQVPCESTTENLTQKPCEKPIQPTTELVTEVTTSISNEKPTEATTEKITEATTEAVTQKPTENTTQAQNNSQSKTMEQQVVDLVNKYRAENGLKPLKINSSVSRVAQAKSEDMKDKNYFDHISPTYGSPFEMLKSFGISYKTAGENIAKGQKTAEAVVNAWMNSEGHRKNILNANYEEIGVGYATGNGTTYWTQLFITQQ